MSRILAYTSPARGHLFPLVSILEELHRRGHRVAVRTLASEVPMLRSLGIHAEPIAPQIETIEHDDWKAKLPIEGVKRAVRTFRDRAAFDVPDLQRAIEQERPDALLVDVATIGALTAAEAWGGPWAAFCPFPLSAPSREAPPYGPGLRPMQGPLGSLRDRLVRAFVDWALYRPLSSWLDEMRAELTLPPLDHPQEMFLRPPLLLYMSAEGFDYPRAAWPPNVVMVGPCDWDPPAELPEELAGIEAPLVLVTTSSEFQNDGRLVRVALDALAGEPFHVVATQLAGGVGEPTPPQNASVLPFTPHAPVLARAICAITHGGMGATQKALARGVPVCVVPFGRDQFEVARRVEVAGAGSRLPPWRLSPERLRAKVHEAIAHRPGAERVAEAFANTGGAATAASAVERRLL